MARRDSEMASALFGLAGLGVLAYLVWPKKAAAASFPPAQPAQPGMTPAKPPSLAAQAQTQLTNAAIGVGVTAALGGVKAGGSALVGLLSGGSAAPAAATTTTAAAGGTAATGASGAAMLTGLGVASAMAALIAAAKWYESKSDRATNARVLEDALNRMMIAIRDDLQRQGKSFAVADTLCREWGKVVSVQLRDVGKQPIAAGWITNIAGWADTLRAANPNAPHWTDMVRGALDDGTRLATALPILAGNAYGVFYMFEFFQKFPTAPYYLDTDWYSRHDRTGAAMPPTSAENAAIDFAKAGIVPVGFSGSDFMQFLYTAFPNLYPNPNPVSNQSDLVVSNVGTG